MDSGLASYFDHANERWYHWFVAIQLDECNATGTQTVDLGIMEVDSTTGVVSTETGVRGSGDGLYLVIQISESKIWVDNNKPGFMAYDDDSGGSIITGREAQHEIYFTIDTTSMALIGTVDNSDEFSIDVDWGTWYDIGSLRDGTIPSSSTLNNFHVTGAATYMVVA